MSLRLVNGRQVRAHTHRPQREMIASVQPPDTGHRGNVTRPSLKAGASPIAPPPTAGERRPNRFGIALQVAGAATMLGICAFVVLRLHSLSHGTDYHAISRWLHHLPWQALLGAAVATVVSHAALVGRDAAILRFIGVQIDRLPLLIGAVCGSALGNAVGFGALSGGAVRYRIYGAVGVRADQIARLMLWITVCFGIGLVAFAAASAVVAAPDIGRLLHISARFVRYGGLGIAGAIAVGLLVVCRSGRPAFQLGRLRLERPTPGFVSAQTVLLAIDLLGAGLALWLMLPGTKIGFVAFMAVFTVATALGVISHVPGGMGVFEAVIVVALGHNDARSEVVAALLAYRVLYFFVPLLLSAGLLAGFELRGVRAKLPPSTLRRLKRSIDQLAPMMLGVITFAIGGMLLVSGATPAFSHRLAILQMALPLWVVEVSHFLGSILGVLLLFVARGLSRRLDGAWWMAFGVACISLVVSLAKGLAFVEASILCCLILLLLATRGRFNRPAWLLRETLTAGWLVAIAAVTALAIWVVFFAFREVPLRHDLWWQFEFDATAPRSLRATFGGAIFAALIGLWQLLRLAPGRVHPPTRAEMTAAAAITGEQERSDALLAMVGDKSFLFTPSRQCFLMYSKRGRSWVALYDPVGPRCEWPELIRSFVELAAGHGGRAAFYQVRPENVTLYLEAGLNLMKLGEEAWIRLDRFSLDGPQRSNLRYALKRGPRDGLTFEIIPPHGVTEALPVLKTISDGWLRSHNAREKGFSVARFEPHYLAMQSVALVRQHGEPMGFATYMTTDRRIEATIGVMRYLPGASPYLMEYLFTSLALELKAAGFGALSLGMSPLAGLALTSLSSLWFRIGDLLWQHGNRLYDFQGLRRFKNKFHPEWEARYLAASGGTVGPFLALADVAVMTGGRKAAKPCAV